MATSQAPPMETPPEIRVIEGADHFFSHGEAELFRELRDFPLSPECSWAWSCWSAWTLAIAWKLFG